MLKKFISTVRSTILIWVCILSPLFISIKFIKSSLEEDAARCVDTFIDTEGVGISKYMALQFEKTQKEFNAIISGLQLENFNNAKSVEAKLISLSKNNNISVNVYQKSGKFFASSLGKSQSDLTKDSSLEKLKDEVIYTIEQQEDHSIVVKFISKKNLQIGKGKKDFFFELIVSWDQYEKYMNQLQKGSFPRMFYIISPDCRRYVSLNSLPSGLKNDRAVVALGMHLAQKISDISIGLSNVKIESIDFKIFKDEVKMQEKMSGNKFFAIVATDKKALETLSDSMFSALPITMMILIIIWLVVCLLIARFYNKTKEQLEIANVISDSTPLAIIIFKASDGTIMKINLSATTLLRIEKEEIGKIDMWHFFIEEDDKNYITNAVTSNINVTNYEVLVQSFGGGSFWSICSASPVDIEEEKYIVLAVLDINRRKEIEKKLANNAALLEQQVAERTLDLEGKAKELKESNALLEKSKLIADEANNAKTKFLTNMSNELKTPINAIIGYSEILEEEALDRKDTVSANDLRKVIGSAKHLLSLIDEILDLSKIEAGKTQLSFDNIEVINMIKDVEGVTMPLIANNDNSLFSECPKDIGTMYSDATKIRQCLLNLLSNAAKFTQLGKITLRVAPIVKNGEDFIEFSVIDTGVGIAADKIETIFEPFQENVSKNSGAGLGLSLTKKYTEYLGGNVSVESEVGIGSKFIIRIPRTCKTESSEFIEVKNQKKDEILEEFIDETDAVAANGITKEVNSFSRKSDQPSI